MRRFAVIDLVVLLAATLLTHAVILRHRTPMVGADSRGYIVPARNFVAGLGLLGDGNPTTFVDAVPGYPNRPSPDAKRSPVVPLMIAAFLAAGAGLSGVIVFQYALNFAAAVALYFFVRRLLTSRLIALAAALFFVCSYPVAEMANQIGSETPFTLLVLCAILLTHRACAKRSSAIAAAAGLTLGLAVLTRPIAMYFFVVLAAIVVFATRRAAIAVVLVVASLILPAAWMWRNYRETGAAIVSTIPADSLLSQWAAGVHATRNSSHLERLTAVQQQLGFRAALHRSRLPLFYQAMAVARAEGHDPVALNAAQKSVYERQLALHVVRSHPAATAELMVSAIVELQIVLPATAVLPRGVRDDVVTIAFVPIVFAALACVAFGVRAIFRRDPALALLIAATIIYFTVAAAIPETVSRYAIVFIPFYGTALFAGLAPACKMLTNAWRRFRARAAMAETAPDR